MMEKRFDRHGKPIATASGEEFVRVRFPNEKDNEILGLVEEMLGGGRMRVSCVDGKVRMARIPGKIKRKTWVRLGDIVLLRKWPNEEDKADMEYRYVRQQVDVLQKKGYLKELM